MTKRRLWVVEIKQGGGKWLPCCPAFLTRAEARAEAKASWEDEDYRSRVVSYEPSR